MRPCNMPNFFGATDDSDTFVSFIIDGLERSGNADATFVNTFKKLELTALEELSSLIPNIYAIGPSHLFLGKMPQGDPISKHIRGNLWEEHVECLGWLNRKEPGSILYVNFPSIAFLTHETLTEFVIGLVNSHHLVLWVLRPDIVNGENTLIPPGFIDETKVRGLLSGWCPQEKDLKHSSVGGFLTHCGWNSVLESLSAGVPMLCWLKFVDQQTNARYICTDWMAVLEAAGGDMRRDDVERVVRELLGGEKGMELKRTAMEWKRLDEEATIPTGSSVKNLDKLVKDVLST